MKEPIFGKTHVGMAGKRDAIHVATISAIAKAKLYPGQPIGINPKTSEATESSSPIAIVDPFLQNAVFPGTEFWAFINPHTVTGLSHQWELPALDESIRESPSKEESIEWLTEWADQGGLSYERLIEIVKERLSDGGYECDGGRYEGMYTDDEFWSHIHNATDIEESEEGGIFTCSC